MVVGIQAGRDTRRGVRRRGSSAWAVVSLPALALSLVLAHAACADDIPHPPPGAVDTVATRGFAPDSVLRDVGDVLSSWLGRQKVQTEVELAPRKGLSIVALPSIGYNPA